MFMYVGWVSKCLSVPPCVCKIYIYISVVYCMFGPLTRGIDYYSILKVFLSSVIGSLYGGCFLFVVCFSLCLKMQQLLLPTHVSCVLQGITHHYDCYCGSDLCWLNGNE